MRTPLLIVIVALATACVPKGKYLDLESQLAAESAELVAAEGTIAEQEGFLQQAEARYAELDAKKKGLEAEIEKLNSEKAKMLEEQGQLEASVTEMEEALAELTARKAAADSRVRAYRDLVERFQALIDAGRLQVKIVDGRMVVQLATDILFASGSASLSEDGKAAVQEVGAVLADIPDRRYQVEGYTDNVPIKTDRFPSNWELASARSLTVVRALVDAGVEADRVSGASFGETRPVADNDTPEGRSQNRRIEIVVVPDLSMLPGAEELKAAASGKP